ncbi:hypothetical protein RTW82_28920, partial [Pseudomonas sp. zfem005]|nr:hypothetical protein [Pseudomonas sp. zfem005]
ESIRSVLRHIEQQIEETLKAINDHIDNDPDLRGKRDLLTSIDGIADKTAADPGGAGRPSSLHQQPRDYRLCRAQSAFAGVW